MCQNGQNARRTTAGEPERTFVREDSAKGVQRRSLPIITHRYDIVVQTDKYIYIMELKMDATADEALQQIEDKGYAKPFAADPRKLFKIGVGFSSETRRIKEWKMA